MLNIAKIVTDSVEPTNLFGDTSPNKTGITPFLITVSLIGGGTYMLKFWKSSNLKGYALKKAFFYAIRDNDYETLKILISDYDNLKDIVLLNFLGRIKADSNHNIDDLIRKGAILELRVLIDKITEYKNKVNEDPYYRGNLKHLYICLKRLKDHYGCAQVEHEQFEDILEQELRIYMSEKIKTDGIKYYLTNENAKSVIKNELYRLCFDNCPEIKVTSRISEFFDKKFIEYLSNSWHKKVSRISISLEQILITNACNSIISRLKENKSDMVFDKDYFNFLMSKITGRLSKEIESKTIDINFMSDIRRVGKFHDDEAFIDKDNKKHVEEVVKFLLDKWISYVSHKILDKWISDVSYKILDGWINEFLRQEDFCDSLKEEACRSLLGQIKKKDIKLPPELKEEISGLLYECLSVNCEDKTIQTIRTHIIGLNDIKKLDKEIILNYFEYILKDLEVLILSNISLITLQKAIQDIQLQLIQKHSQLEVSLDTLVWSAVKKGDSKQLTALLRIDSNLEITNEEGLTLLHLATIHEHQDIIPMLLEKNPKLLNVQDKQGKTALHHAAKKGNENILTFLLQKNPDLSLKDKHKKTAHDYAINSGEEIRKLIPNHMLLKAAKVGSVNDAKKALELGAEINTQDKKTEETALHIAAYHGHKELIFFLIEKGANKEAKNIYKEIPTQVTGKNEPQEAIHYAHFLRAIENDDKTVISLMIKEGGEGLVKNARGSENSTALHIAVRCENIEVIKDLLNIGIDVNLLNNQKQTPLHIAAQTGNKEVVELLLDKGADIMLKDIQGMIPSKLAKDRELSEFIYEFAINKQNEKVQTKDASRSENVPNTTVVTKIAHRNAPSDIPQIPGLKYHKIPGDGHCLFNAVALYVGESQDFLRIITAAHLEHNLEEFRGFIETSGKDIKQYLHELRNGIEWASDIEIEILMRLLKRPIVVIRPTGNIANDQNVRGFSGEPIFVYYNDRDHYDVLLLAEGANGREILNTLLTQSSTAAQQPITPSNQLFQDSYNCSTKSASSSGPQIERLESALPIPNYRSAIPAKDKKNSNSNNKLVKNDRENNPNNNNNNQIINASAGIADYRYGFFTTASQSANYNEGEAEAIQLISATLKPK